MGLFVLSDRDSWVAFNSVLNQSLVIPRALLFGSNLNEMLYSNRPDTGGSLSFHFSSVTYSSTYSNHPTPKSTPRSEIINDIQSDELPYVELQSNSFCSVFDSFVHLVSFLNRIIVTVKWGQPLARSRAAAGLLSVSRCSDWYKNPKQNPWIIKLSTHLFAYLLSSSALLHTIEMSSFLKLTALVAAAFVVGAQAESHTVTFQNS